MSTPDLALDLETDNIRWRHVPSGMSVPEQPMRISEADLKTQKTHGRLPLLAPTLADLSLAESLEGRVTLGTPLSPALLQLSKDLPTYKAEIEETINRVSETGELPKPFEFPNLAWEAIKAGLEQDDFIYAKLNEHISNIETAHADIALLLNLNAELSGVEDEEGLSEKAREILEELSDRGIDIEAESVGEIKQLAGSHESRLRSEIQIKFTTKVQYLMQNLQSLNEILQKIIQYDSKLKEYINQRPK